MFYKLGICDIARESHAGKPVSMSFSEISFIDPSPFVNRYMFSDSLMFIMLTDFIESEKLRPN